MNLFSFSPAVAYHDSACDCALRSKHIFYLTVLKARPGTDSHQNNQQRTFLLLITNVTLVSKEHYVLRIMVYYY